MNIYERFEMLTLEKMAAAKVELPLSDTVSAVDTDADSTNILAVIFWGIVLFFALIFGVSAYNDYKQNQEKKQKEKELLAKSQMPLKAD